MDAESFEHLSPQQRSTALGALLAENKKGNPNFQWQEGVRELLSAYKWMLDTYPAVVEEVARANG